jgi:cytidylate kinase
MKGLKIALDGPAGSGKSSVSRLVAKRLGYLNVDTGAMYRCVTLRAIWDGVDFEDPKALAKVAASCRIELQEDGRVILDGQDVTDEIRKPIIDSRISSIAENEEVRKILVAEQKRIGAQGGVVMEGRDIGTVVLPDAEIKFYLDAAPQERAKRRWKELGKRGVNVSLDEVKHEICLRDKKDLERSASPLKLAPDAIYLDTSNHTLNEVVEIVLAKIQGVVRTHEANKRPCL